MNPPLHTATPNERISLLEAAHKVLVDELVDIRMTVRNISDRLQARPSWTVTTYITIVTALSTGLLGFLVSNARK